MKKLEPQRKSEGGFLSRKKIKKVKLHEENMAGSVGVKL